MFTSRNQTKMIVSNGKAKVFISHNQAKMIDSLSRSNREKKVREGQYPQPVRLGERRIAFVKSEVEAWVAERINERDLGRATDPLPGHQRVAEE